jgi:type IV secretory pathway VirB10-like protein
MADTPPAASPASDSVATVTDKRPVPRGVLPRHVQTWVMAGLAVGMLAIMLLVGRPAPPARPATAAASVQPPSADRVRDYQDRLRVLEAQALQDAQPPTVAPGTGPSRAASSQEPRAPATPDAIETDRKRREYESLFAGNVVLSRRPENERPDLGRSATQPGTSSRSEPTSPSVDEVADAVVRASTRSGALATNNASSLAPLRPPAPATVAPARQAEASRTPERTDPISAAGPLHRVLEGTLIDTVLTNRLDGAGAAPVSCLVTNPVYSYNGQQVLIPAGARVLGETKPVQAFGETRLAVSFHRLLLPDGRTYRLDQFLGLNQIGDAGLRDRVNQHYLSTFGAAAAVGLINGLSQYLGSAGLSDGNGDRTIVIAGGVGDAASQSTGQVMNRFLNRLPTITIREGHRVKVYLTSDLELPAYVAPTAPTSF